jgi:hypothetical protein
LASWLAAARSAEITSFRAAPSVRSSKLLITSASLSTNVLFEGGDEVWSTAALLLSPDLATSSSAAATSVAAAVSVFASASGLEGQ